MHPYYFFVTEKTFLLNFHKKQNCFNQKVAGRLELYQRLVFDFRSDQ